MTFKAIYSRIESHDHDSVLTDIIWMLAAIPCSFKVVELYNSTGVDC